MKGLFDSPTHPPPEGKAAALRKGKVTPPEKGTDHRLKANTHTCQADLPAPDAHPASRRPASASCVRGAELPSLLAHLLAGSRAGPGHRPHHTPQKDRHTASRLQPLCTQPPGRRSFQIPTTFPLLISAALDNCHGSCYTPVGGYRHGKVRRRCLQRRGPR